MNKFKVSIIEADNVFYEGEIESLVIPAVDGEYGVMAMHQNVVVAVVPGSIRIKTGDGETLDAVVSDGMMRVEDGEVLLLVDSAEWPEEIDIEKAKKLEQAAKEAMLQKNSAREYMLAEASLRRTMSRLKFKDMNNGQL